MPSATLLGIAQDAGVPQAGCFCQRCMAVHKGKAPELYPVALGIKDADGKHHLIEASRTLPRQLYLWAKSISDTNDEPTPINPISTLILTHFHLGHIDGIGQFGREALGAPVGSIRLITGKPVIDDLKKKSALKPFRPEAITNGSKVHLGTGVCLEFLRVPHREHEGSETYGIVVRGQNKSILFLPDHDTYEETLDYHNMSSIREWFKSIKVDIAMVDGSFYSVQELADRRSDFGNIPHPPISETLRLLGRRDAKNDPEIVFIHLNHSNPILDNKEKQLEVEKAGWGVGLQGQVWEI